MRQVARIVLLVGLATLVLPTTEAAAQDWTVKRDPFDKRLVGRYKAILKKSPEDQKALRSLVRMYRKHRTVSRLVKEYEKQADKRPSYAVYFVLGRIADWDKKAAKALEHFEKAHEQAPDKAAPLWELGRLEQERGNAGDAAGWFEKALPKAKKKKDKKRLLHALVQLALDRADTDAAEKHAETYFRLFPKDSRARLDLADGLLRLKKYDAALAAYKSAEKQLASDPSMRLEVIARIGAAEEAAGRDKAALKTYARAMSMTQKGYHLRRELVARIVDIYRRRQDLTTLLRRYEKQWKPGARDHFEWHLLAKLYEEVGNQDKAIEAFRKAAQKAPYELDTHRRLISLLETSGRDKEALRQYEKVVKIAPGEARFQLELAKRYWRHGKDKKALSLLRRVEARFAGDPGVYASLADLYTRWGKDKLALKAFKRLTAIDPNEVAHLVNLGEQYFQRGDKARAVSIWKRIISKRNADNYAQLGRVFAEHDMLKDALGMYSKAIKMAPKKPAMYRGRAIVYERQKKYKEAGQDWEQVLAHLGDDPASKAQVREARLRVVHLLKRRGGSTLARRISRWQAAFSADPPDVEAGHFLVEAYLRQRQLADARKTLQRLLSLKKGDMDAMHQLVKVYRSERNYEKAIELLDELAKASPGREREYFTQIAELNTILNRDGEAIDYAKRALEKAPKDPLAYLRLAERYEHMQQYEDAIDSYGKAIELDPRRFKAYFSLARLYRNQDQPSKAADLYHQVLRRATETPLLAKAGREAIGLGELTGGLGALEQVLAPLAFTLPHKKVYRRTLVELYGRYVPSLVERSTRLQDEAATAELSRLGAHGLKPLLEALSDETDPRQQRIAVRVLGHLGNQGAAAPLVKLASSRASEMDRTQARGPGSFVPVLDWDVRVEALVAAGRLGDPRTIPALLSLANHREASMREAAVFALGNTTHKKAVPALMAALEDPLQGVQVLACLGLSRVKKPVVGRRLAGVVVDENRADTTRAACAYALGRIGDRAHEKTLVSILNKGNDRPQRAAAWALGELGAKRALPALFTAYYTRRAHVRVAAGGAIARLLGQSVKDGPKAVREYPMLHGKFAPEAAVDDLLRSLPEGEFPRQATVGREKEIADSISDALHKHRDIVVRVLRGLDQERDTLSIGTVGTPTDASKKSVQTIGMALRPHLLPLLSHRDASVRGATLSVLAKSKAPEAEKAILSALSDRDADVRRRAMIAAATLGRLGHPSKTSLTGAITERLENGRWQDRVAAANALGEMRESGVAGRALIGALKKDRNSFVRESSASALGVLKHRAAAPALAEAASYRNESIGDVRIAALRALLVIDPENGRELIRQAAKSDPAASVRTAARELLPRTRKR